MKLVSFGILLFVAFSFSALGQNNLYGDDEQCNNRSGLEYGGVAGFYIPGNGTADFYSGKPENDNSVKYVLSNKYWYDEIFLLTGAYDTVFVRECPGKMRYNPAFSFGLFVQYNRNCRTAFYLQFFYARLTARDIVSFEVDPPIDYLAEPDIRLYPLIGTEERNMVDLGFTHTFGNNPVARWQLGGGINMNNTLVKESIVRIEERNFNMVNVYGNRPFVPGGTQQSYEIRQGGIGFGVFGSIGGRFEFSEAVAIEPGISVYYKQINMENYRGFYPQFNLYLRLCFRDLLSFSE